MKTRFPISVLSALLVVTTSFAQQPFSQKYGNEEDYRRLYFLNIQYVQSWVKSDTATYNRLLWAEDFVQQNSGDGQLYVKKQTLPIFGAPRFDKIEYFYPENVSIEFITNDAALVFSRTPFRMKSQGTAGLSQYNDVYVKRNGAWVCVAANISQIKKPGETFEPLKEVPAPVQLLSYYPGTETDRALLTELNAKHAEGFVRSRTDLLNNILAEDFILLQVDGLLYDRKQVLANVNASASTNSIVSYSVENCVIRFVAPDVAMIQAALISQKKDGSRWGTQYNDIYVKRDGKWICVSGNNTMIRDRIFKI